MDDDRQSPQREGRPPSLPPWARQSLNRCNLPAVILGGLTYQAHPVPLELDGVRPLHKDLLDRLDAIPSHDARARAFVDYMCVHFRLEHLEEAGLQPGRHKRVNANYLRLLRGWSFDPDGREGAVLKAWVESRFGLLARHHAGPLGGRDSEARHAYLRQAAAGLYATNAVEAQLDLLYTYCQHELACRHPGASHLTLYRGVNRIAQHEVLERLGGGRYRVLLNNLSSFSRSRERADEFGDQVLEARVPLPKVFFFDGLLPGRLEGEDEVVVIGGVYEVGIGIG
jgi:NAD+--dinitrogen-reductase ADP-D-ribosyltransferase